MIQHICEQSGYAIERVRAVVSSPPCESFSLADASNISRDNHYREHGDPTKPPRLLESCKTERAMEKRKKAIKDDNMIRNLLESYEGCC